MDLKKLLRKVRYVMCATLLIGIICFTIEAHLSPSYFAFSCATFGYMLHVNLTVKIKGEE